MFRSIFAYGSPIFFAFVFIVQKCINRVGFVKPINADLVSGMAEIEEHEASLVLPTDEEKAGYTKWQVAKSWIF